MTQISKSNDAPDRETGPGDTRRIAGLNDAFRKSLDGGQVLLTRGVASFPPEDRRAVLRLVREFDDFTPDNDPWEEHDFGSIEYGGTKIFWKIDYYDPDFHEAGIRFGSEDPSDPEKTVRVLTVMLAEEY